DVTYFVMQELEYMLDFLSNNSMQRDYYTSIVFDRLFGYFNNIVGGKYLKNDDENFESRVQELRNQITKFVSDLPKGQKYDLLHNKSLCLFLNSPDVYKSERMCSFKAYEDEKKQFGKIMENENRVVIFGAGEMGQSLDILLRCNNYNGNIVFCDNNVKLQGTDLMGTKIYSVPEAVDKYKDAVYIISNRRYEFEILNQLLEMGIEREKICCGLDVSPHSAMEIKWR
ncbi:MAG: hypothetical protein K6G40_06860, partial [Eubacterium sp.]|nr:hypothetical protein [Eubacterium sp.]